MSTIYTETANDARAELAATLADAIRYTDRASHTLPNGDRVEVTTAPDHDNRLEDCDYFGAVYPQRANPHHTFDRFGQRPAECNGRARVVYNDWNTRIWWQPPADVPPGGDTERAQEQHIRGWYANDWHYMGVIATLYATCACCEKETERERASLWGIESNTGAEYLADVIGDLLAECGA
jgi:hypothetical protein